MWVTTMAQAHVTQCGALKVVVIATLLLCVPHYCGTLKVVSACGTLKVESATFILVVVHIAAPAADSAVCLL